eukprot:997940-Pelagomonas_calceolata.AAC.1
MSRSTQIQYQAVRSILAFNGVPSGIVYRMGTDFTRKLSSLLAVKTCLLELIYSVLIAGS